MVQTWFHTGKRKARLSAHNETFIHNNAALYTAWHYKTQQATNDMETNQLASKQVIISQNSKTRRETRPARLAQLNMFLLNVGHGEICLHVRLKEHVTTLFKWFHSWRGKEKRKINTWSLYFKPAQMPRSDSSYLSKCFLTQWPESITVCLEMPHTILAEKCMTTGERKICKN